MVEKIDLQELLDYIEKRIELNEMSTIHIYDYNKIDKVLDVNIEPYKEKRIEYFEIDKAEENPYDVVFEALKDIYPGETEIHVSRGYIYGYSVHVHICKLVHVILEFYYEEGNKWMIKTYEEYKK